MLTFCTLFDSNYLDKGLVLYDSMKSVMENFKLYILAMDARCEEILNDLALEHAIVISLNEFEDEEMLEIKVSLEPGFRRLRGHLRFLRRRVPNHLRKSLPARGSDRRRDSH